jgi:leucyl aminopeptidase
MTKIKTSPKPLSEQPKKCCRFILTDKKSSWHRLVETKDGQLEYHLGAGEQKDWTMRTFRTLVRSIVQAAKSHQLEYISLEISLEKDCGLKEVGDVWVYETLSYNLALASYEFSRYKSKKKDYQLKEIVVCNVSGKNARAFKAGLTIAEATNTARDIANTTAEDMSPSKLATAAKKAMTGTKASVKVLDHKQIAKLKMGLLEAVGKGATDREKLIVIEYWGKKKPTKAESRKAAYKPTVLVGKGITFDTGGLNIKPSGYMHEMHMDMSGGSSVIGALRAIAKLGLKENVIGIIPAAENAVSARAMRAGDIATSMSGKTVEILHTDAEGRLVLADALTYSQKNYDPKLILDIATLTGAAVVALGQHASAVLTKNDALREQLITIGEQSGDLTWPLPLWSEYEQYLKSTRADIANIATNFSRFGGTIEGGTFLAAFVDKKIPWAHIDIAPRMESISSDKLAKGSTGEPVALLVKMVQDTK